MAEFKLKGNPFHTVGDLPATGTAAPAFSLARTDLSAITLDELKGKRVVLNIFPSLDTDVCAASVRRFNAEAGGLDNTVVLCVSMDLPFAHKRFCTTEGLVMLVVAADLPFAMGRFCGAEGVGNVSPLSMMRSRKFAKDYGVLIEDGPLAGLLARSVVVLDTQGRVIHAQLVPETIEEPDYPAALAALK